MGLSKRSKFESPDENEMDAMQGVETILQSPCTDCQHQIFSKPLTS